MNFAWAFMAFLFLSGCTMDASLKQTKIAISSLGSGALVSSGQKYELTQLSWEDSSTTFVQWIPNTSGKKGPVVIYMMPYEGITWTGLEVDTQWATKGTGWFPDVNGPYFNASTSANVSYWTTDPADSYYTLETYLRNDISVLAIYGRYYAGADIKNSVQAVLDGLSFLKEQSIVDTSKIAITGESWGAFAPLYAMASESNDIKLVAASLLFPMSDAQQAYDFAFTTVPSLTTNPTALANFNAFFEPYFRRINKSSEELASQNDRYRNYRHTKLIGLTTPLFIVHDEWDTSVPKSSSDDLISLLPNAESRHYFHLHNTTLDMNTAELAYTQSSDPLSKTISLMWGQVFMISKLMSSSEPKSISYDAVELYDQFDRTHQAKLLDLDTSFYLPLLKLLCDPNITLTDTSYPDATGPEALLYLYQNAIGGAPWNTATSANICSLMDANPVF